VVATKAPYSQAVIYQNLLFVSGQIAYDPSTKGVIKGTYENEADAALQNLKAIIEEAGSSLDKVLKVTVFLTDMEDFEEFNGIYKKYFEKEPPARTCIEVSSLPFGAKVEIEAIAHF
jgi:2-iminobutanoate/2-iminopropanoate deaminase